MTAVLVGFVLVILCFAGIILWALRFQSGVETAAMDLSADEAWRLCGLSLPGPQGFSLYQILPSQGLTKAEYRIQDQLGGDLGRYIGSNGRKSATLEYGGKTAQLYIQGALFVGSQYPGKVGGTANDSIVIRDADRVIAEVWRIRVFPAIGYRFIYAGKSFEINWGGVWPTALGSITHDRERIGGFRRYSISSRSLLLALQSNLSQELKVCICGICLLQ